MGMGQTAEQEGDEDALFKLLGTSRMDCTKLRNLPFDFSSQRGIEFISADTYTVDAPAPGSLNVSRRRSAPCKSSRKVGTSPPAVEAPDFRGKLSGHALAGTLSRPVMQQARPPPLPLIGLWGAGEANCLRLLLWVSSAQILPLAGELIS